MLPPRMGNKINLFKLLKPYIVERLNKYITILRDGSEINIQLNKSLDPLEPVVHVKSCIQSVPQLSIRRLSLQYIHSLLFCYSEFRNPNVVHFSKMSVLIKLYTIDKLKRIV
jgi:hypothetical protein